MRTYLSLIPISAKVHKRQNRMTLLCIAISVFLVTAIFSVAEMGIRMETARLTEKHGTMTLGDIVSSTMGQAIAVVSVVLFLLILIAGVLMISGSINSNVAQRTRFFGMMRCIGMSKEQIIHFVRLEALNWCKTAIAEGLALGIVTAWALCAVLHYVVADEFSEIPVFGISWIGIIGGIAVGIITVLIAASAPAKRAAKVSPACAVSGNVEHTDSRGKGIKTGLFKIETGLGIQHAVKARKNLVLMTGSFALSIILFLCFLVLIDLVNYVMPQYRSAADVTVFCSDEGNSLDASLLNSISSMDGVKRVFGRRSSFDLPAVINGADSDSDTIDVISYDDFDLRCLRDDGILRKGSDVSKVFGDSHYVLATWDKDSTLRIGDTVQIGSEELEIAGLLKYDPFSSDGTTARKITLITSGETFLRLTGVSGYKLILIQTTNEATDETVDAIRSLIGNTGAVSDSRDQRTFGTYMAFMLFVYGFLAIIALVTLLNIVNSIAMSVSAKMKQYGAMRAVGMSVRQVTKMIAAEALTYALSGCMAGCAVGLALHRLLFHILIESHFAYAIWSLPVIPLLIVVCFVLLAVIASTAAPAARIRKMAITETINEL